MKKIFLSVLSFLFCISSVLAYTPSSSVLSDSRDMAERLETYLSKRSASKVESLLSTLNSQLPVLQLGLMKKGNIAKAYQLEYLRRHLPGAEIIETADLIDDDLLGITWTRAPDGFDLMYFPYETPSFASLDPDDNYTALING